MVFSKPRVRIRNESCTVKITVELTAKSFKIAKTLELFEKIFMLSIKLN